MKRLLKSFIMLCSISLVLSLTACGNPNTETGKKPAELFSLIRIAVSFAPFSPALHLTLEALGKDRVLSRLNFASRSID